MAALPPLLNPRPFVCRRCLLRYRLHQVTRRGITENFLWKQAQAADRWRDQARDIREGRKDSMLKILEDRGYVNSIAGDRDEFDDLLTSKRVGVYVGIDPTAASLHVGHLVPLMALFWMHNFGFLTVTLVGGATGKIGDPTDRLKSREKRHSSIHKANMISIHYQLKALWMNAVAYGRKYGYQDDWAKERAVVNNNTWLNKVTAIEFLKVLGPGVRLGAMLSRDTVKKRMSSGDGMSFAEFAYPIIQSWDWWHLYNQRGVQVQIGGSDQYGNIVAGVDAVKYVARNHDDPRVRDGKTDKLMQPFGFTVPLLTTASGEKFGKSAGNAVWLDKDMTSVFDLYQFFLRSADADVERYLKLFTFVPLSHIRQVIEQHLQDPSKRVAQKLLAREVVFLVHGEQAAKHAESDHNALFRKPSFPAPSSDENSEQDLQPGASSRHSRNPIRTYVNQITNPDAPQVNWTNAPSANVFLPRSLVYGQPFPKVLHAAGLVSSRSEGHRMVVKQGAYVGSAPGQVGGMGDEIKFTPIKTYDATLTEKFVQEDGLLLLRVGKWKVKICLVIDDEEFEKRGLDVPGWKEFKERRDGLEQSTSVQGAETLQEA